MHTTTIFCPSCFEPFEILTPPPQETPCEVDYDCEICCRPMRVLFDCQPSAEFPEVTAQALGLAD